jgi:hypothetical protein
LLSAEVPDFIRDTPGILSKELVQRGSPAG